MNLGFPFNGCSQSHFLRIPVSSFTNMGFLNYSILRKIVFYFYALFGFINKWLFRLKGTESNSSLKLKTIEVGEEIADHLIGSDSIGSAESVGFGFEEPESFLRFRFQSYEEFIGIARDDDECLSDTSSHEDFYDPSFDDQIVDDSLCDKDDTIVGSIAESLRGGGNEDPKAEKSGDHYNSSDEPCVCFISECVLGGGDEDPKAERSYDHCKSSDELLVCLKSEYVLGGGDGDHKAERSYDHSKSLDEPRVCLEAESVLGDGDKSPIAEKGYDHCKSSDGPRVCLKPEPVPGDGDEDPIAEKEDDHCKNSDGPRVCSKAVPLHGDGEIDAKAEKGDDPCKNSDYSRVPEHSKPIKGDDHCKNSYDRLVPEDAKPFADEDFEVSSGSDSESVVSSSNFSIRSSLLDSVNGAYLSDELEGMIDLSILKGAFEIGKEELNTKLTLEEAELQELNKGYENDDFEDDEELLEELKGIEEDVAMEKEENEDENSPKEEESLDWEEEPNGMETQWEHQDLIEQLRMEIGKVRAVGLPTIFEDSEPPKVADDLKPWKIDEKLFRTGGTMGEVHKFYKSYRERMRKFDIFNYQKMYAIGFLRLKDPMQSFSPQKISLSTIVSQDCWPCKPKSSSTSNYSMLKFTRELESDLETVYVGQLCLSWEFLCWEYGKALALSDADPHEIRQFNEVAGEFQQFQVLLQRFLEDEPFRGSGRVQYYVKNRCINRRLLQVPVIREDSVKVKMKQIRAGITSKDAITSLMIIEMIEESIRLLWQLVRTDKEGTTSGLLNFRKESHTDLQNPDDATLLIEVQETLRKKQKKLKELMRSECCILKKLQRNQNKQDYASRVLGFFSQVDLKLVSRVLNMTRVTTDQLVWCSSKLENIEFVDNRIRRESSFLLFPCS